jgi:hypothetical protein
VNEKPTPAKKTWLAAKFDPKRYSLIPLVVAGLLAYETFSPIDTAAYSWISAAGVVVAAGWALFKGVKAKAWWALIFAPIFTIWLMPIVGWQIFISFGQALGFIVHAIAALAFAVAAYSFLAFDRKAKK